MAFLCITEIADIGYAAAGAAVMAPDMPPVAEQAIPIDGTVRASAPFQNGTRYIMIQTDTTCYLGWGGDPVSPRHRVVAGERLFYGVRAGNTVSVVQGV